MRTAVRTAIAFFSFIAVASSVNAQQLAYVVGQRDIPPGPPNRGIQIITVINTATNAIVARIPAGESCVCVNPDTIAISPDGSRLYVSQFSRYVSIVDTAARAMIGTLDVGEGYFPTAVAISPDGARVYVLKSDGGTSSISAFSTATNAFMGSIPFAGNSARGMSIAPNGSRLYASTYLVSNNKLMVIDDIFTGSNTVVAAVPIEGSPSVGVDVSPDGSFVYVTNLSSNSVSAISTATNTVVATVGLGPRSGTSFGANSARVNPNGSRVYVATYENHLSIIDATTNTLIGSVPSVNFAPRTLEFTADGTRAYVATAVNVRIVNTATNSVVGTIPYILNTDGIPAAIVMSPTRVIASSGDMSFGSVLVGASASRTLTITNTGNAALKVNSISYPAGFSGDWAGGLILAGKSQNVSVTFSPTARGSHTGNITVNANQTGGSPTIAVSGIGKVARPGDFDGDGKTDLPLFRPSEGTWYVRQSSSNYSSWLTEQWGSPTDIPVPGDYDGDSKTDLGIFRPSEGTWYIKTSTSNYESWITVQWGGGSDIPVPGDYDGDAKADLGIFRPSIGTWFVKTSSTGYSSWITIQWGTQDDIPLPGDYDGDGKADLGIYRPSLGVWFIKTSSSNYESWVISQWGAASDIPLLGDYDGDRRADLAIFRPSSGTWFIKTSTTNYASWITVQWGGGGDIPVPGDYDDDGKTDLGIFRPSVGTWFVKLSSTGYASWITIQWGSSTDMPVVSASPWAWR